MSKLLFINLLILGLSLPGQMTNAQSQPQNEAVRVDCPVIEIVADVTAPKPGLKDGTIELQITGGEQPYQIYWINSNGDLPNKSRLEGLSKGFYSVVVVDKNRCSKTLMNINVGEKSERN